ncbi:hypothetical protein ACHQM5_025553 [Ranunculus cassubicifolius]
MEVVRFHKTKLNRIPVYWLYQGFRRATVSVLPESQALYLHSVLTHRAGSAAMLSLIYSEVLKMLRLWGLLNFEAEIYCPHDEVNLPKGYHKLKSRISDQAHILTTQSLLVEAIVNEDASGDVLTMRIEIQQLKKEIIRLQGLADGGTEYKERDTGISFPGSPGSFKWDALQGFSPLTSNRRISQKKEFEAALIGAFKREREKDIALQALAAENQATMHLGALNESGRDEAATSGSKVTCEVSHVLFYEQVRLFLLSRDWCLYYWCLELFV